MTLLFFNIFPPRKTLAQFHFLENGAVHELKFKTRYCLLTLISMAGGRHVVLPGREMP